MINEHDSQPLAGEFPVVPQQDRALHKRQALLDKAQALFAEHGYEKTNAKLIAKHAGVAIGTFYRYFTDKSQVLVTLLQDRIEELLPGIPQLLEGDPEAVVFSLLERHSAQMRASALSNAFEEMLMHAPDVAKLVQQQVQARFVDVLRQAHDRGLTWPDIDLDSTAWAVYVLVHEGCRGDVADRNPILLRSLAKMICRMLMPPEVLARMKKAPSGRFPAEGDC